MDTLCSTVSELNPDSQAEVKEQLDRTVKELISKCKMDFKKVSLAGADFKTLENDHLDWQHSAELELESRTLSPELKQGRAGRPGGAAGGKPEQDPGLKWILRAITSVLAVFLLVLAAVYAYRSFQYFSVHEETDDAYVTGHLHQVSSRINGTVEQVLVDDNEHVRQGQVLVLLDPRDYKVKVEQALARLEQARRQAKTASSSIDFQDTSARGQDSKARSGINNATAAIARAEAAVREAAAAIQAAQANLSAREAELERANLDYKRFENLEKEGAISKSQRDSARRDYLVALDNRNAARQAIAQSAERFEQARENVTASKAVLGQARADLQLASASAVQTRVAEHQYQADLAAVAAAQAALAEAKLNLSYTRVVAPNPGRVGKKTVEEGQRVEPGQPLLTIVADNPWVVANYKETQIKHMRPGQSVEIKIDSFPDHKFAGTVLSFSPASGASFAVLPSDNATGNFTKIVQRVPVKILFTPESLKGYEDRMAPGLSVITSVSLVEHAPVSTQKLAELR